MTRLDEIILKFEKEVGDATTLSEVEEIELANRMFQHICEYPFEVLKDEATGSILSDATGPYITLPDNFGYIYENYRYTENNRSNDINMKPRVVFVVSGTARIPYRLVNFSDRKQYIGKDGYCYLDLASNKIRFLVQPPYSTYEYDYVKIPEDLSDSVDPPWPVKYDDAIVYGMAAHNAIFEIDEKGRSYRPEHLAMYRSRINSLKLWNARAISY